MKRTQKKPKKNSEMPDIQVVIDELPVLAKKLAGDIKGGEVFGLVGNLGAGKTTFVKLIASELRVKSTVTSPTFVIMTTHSGLLVGSENVIELHHLDVYRLKHPSEFLQLGIAELFNDPKAVIFIEWADKVKHALPKSTIYIEIKNEKKQKIFED